LGVQRLCKFCQTADTFHLGVSLKVHLNHHTLRRAAEVHSPAKRLQIEIRVKMELRKIEMNVTVDTNLLMYKKANIDAQREAW